jgi:hypothetical protein
MEIEIQLMTYTVPVSTTFTEPFIDKPYGMLRVFTEPFRKIFISNGC